MRCVKQERPEGIAQAFILAAEFIGSAPVALVLGDNLFHGRAEPFLNARSLASGALIFGYVVGEPRHYGVLEFDARGLRSGAWRSWLSSSGTLALSNSSG